MQKETETYAKKIDLDKLALIVENLSTDFKDSQMENRENIKNLSMELARETTKLTFQVERLSITLDKMQEHIAKLIDINMRHSIIKEWIKRSPKFFSAVFGIVIFFFFLFLSDGHKDILKYMATVAKAKYYIQDEKR